MPSSYTSRPFSGCAGLALSRSEPLLATTLKVLLMKRLLAGSRSGRDIAAVLTEKESIRRSRYIETGYYQRAGLAALSRTCQGLDQSVSAALRDAGMSIQSAALNHIGADCTLLTPRLPILKTRDVDCQHTKAARTAARSATTAEAIATTARKVTARARSIVCTTHRREYPDARFCNLTIAEMPPKAHRGLIETRRP